MREEHNTAQERLNATQQQLCSRRHGCSTPRPHESQRSTEVCDVAAVSRDVMGECASTGWPAVRRQTTVRTLRALFTFTIMAHKLVILLQTFSGGYTERG